MSADRSVCGYGAVRFGAVLTEFHRTECFYFNKTATNRTVQFSKNRIRTAPHRTAPILKKTNPHRTASLEFHKNETAVRPLTSSTLLRWGYGTVRFLTCFYRTAPHPTVRKSKQKNQNKKSAPNRTGQFSKAPICTARHRRSMQIDKPHRGSVLHHENPC